MTQDWLLRALEESRARGFLGPHAVEPHLEHAKGYVEAWATVSSKDPETWLDLGSGGGLPGLYLLTVWSTPGTLLDAMAKRTNFLSEVLRWPDSPTGASVYNGRAEELSHDANLEEAFELVVVRSFGPPATTAECAARFLRLGGYLIVSEPPTDEAGRRWDPVGLATLGLERLSMVESGAKFQVLRKTQPTPAQYPRRSGVPAKRPLF